MAKHCSYCNTELERVFKCPCGNVMYCNRECQRNHWKVHKKEFHSNDAVAKGKSKRKKKVQDEWKPVDLEGMIPEGCESKRLSLQWYYKGTTLPSTPMAEMTGLEAKGLVKCVSTMADRMIQHHIKERPKKYLISEYTSKLDDIIECLRAWRAQGCAQKFHIFAKKRKLGLCFHDGFAALRTYTEENVRVNWSMDITALIQLGVIRNDKMNGFKFREVLNS